MEENISTNVPQETPKKTLGFERLIGILVAVALVVVAIGLGLSALMSNGRENSSPTQPASSQPPAQSGNNPFN